jgi:hypothetical protein
MWSCPRRQPHAWISTSASAPGCTWALLCRFFSVACTLYTQRHNHVGDLIAPRLPAKIRFAFLFLGQDKFGVRLHHHEKGSHTPESGCKWTTTWILWSCPPEPHINKQDYVTSTNYLVEICGAAVRMHKVNVLVRCWLTELIGLDASGLHCYTWIIHSRRSPIPTETRGRSKFHRHAHNTSTKCLQLTF